MQIKLIDEFPGNDKAAEFLEKIILDNKIKRVVDIGGGANPLLPLQLVQKYGLEYYVLDIDENELSKAPSWCARLKSDISNAKFNLPELEGKCDLIFSHMLLEHLQDASQAHRNILKLLRLNGIAVHFFPSPHNLPLFVNRVVPEWASRELVKFFQPQRDKKYQVKFPAYYNLCGAPSARLRNIFESLGYSVLEHVGYIGHGYYDRFALTRYMERLARKLLYRFKVPITSTVHVVMKRVR